MKNLCDFNNKNIYLGNNVYSDLFEILTKFGFQNKKILLITGIKSFEDSFFLKDFYNLLYEFGIEVISQIKVKSNPEEKEINDNLYYDNIDLIFCIGGGSVIDFGKALKLKKYKLANLFVFYTLPGSGSAITPFAIFDNNEFKIGEFSFDIIPDVVYVNQKVINLLPYTLKLQAFCDIYAHAIESYFSKQASYTSKDFSQKAYQILFVDSLQKLNIEDFIYADFYAATAESEALVLFPHAIGHYLTYKLGIRHPIASIYYLEEYLKLLRQKNILIDQMFIDFALRLKKELVQYNLLPKVYLTDGEIDEALSFINKYMPFALQNAPAQIEIEEYRNLLKPCVKKIKPKKLLSLLNNTIINAQKSSLYKNKFYHLGKLIDTSEFKYVPFTTKNDLRDHYPYGGLAVDIKDVVEVHTTSGTTGLPTVSFLTKSDLQKGSEAVAQAWQAFGITNQSRVQFIMTYGLFSGAMLNTFALQELGAFVIPSGIQSTQKQIQLMIDYQVDTIVATPGYLLHLIEYLNKHDISLNTLKLKRAIAAGEVYSENIRIKIEKGLDIKVYDHYGLCEVYTGIAYECSERKGLHILDDYVYAEVINPETGDVLGDGEYGELVLTSLGKQASPIIRYRTGDLTSITHESCLCGRKSPRISRIKGRIDDIVFIKGLKLSPNEIKDYILSNYREYIYGSDIQIILKKNSIKFVPELKLSLKDGVQPNILEKIQINIKKQIGVNFNVENVDCTFFNRENCTKVKLVKYIDENDN